MSEHGQEPGPDSRPWASPGGQPAVPSAGAVAPPPAEQYPQERRPYQPSPPGPAHSPQGTGAHYPQPPDRGAGPYGEFRFPEVASPGLEPLAVASVATFPIGPLALGLGIAALRRVRRNRKRSPALAGTGIVLGLLSTAAAVLTIITLVLTGTWDRMTERPVAGDVSAPRVVASANVAPGNCLRTLPVGDSVGEVTQVPCAAEHEAQVIALVDLPGGDDGSGATLLAEAATACSEHLAALIGPHGTDGTAGAQPWYFVPSEQGWTEGDRTAVCLLRSTGPALTTDYFT